MQFLSTPTQLFTSLTTKGKPGAPLRVSRCDEPVRVLDCVVPAGKLPGYCTIEDSRDRLDWLHENALDLVQVGEPPNVGFALVPRKHLVDTPF